MTTYFRLNLVLVGRLTFSKFFFYVLWYIVKIFFFVMWKKCPHTLWYGSQIFYVIINPYRPRPVNTLSKSHVSPWYLYQKYQATITSRRQTRSYLNIPRIGMLIVLSTIKWGGRARDWHTLWQNVGAMLVRIGLCDTEIEIISFTHHNRFLSFGKTRVVDAGYKK